METTVREKISRSGGCLPLARRLDNLGTETAYAVSEEAKALAAKGQRIFPFHIGDENFGTAPAVVAACHKALDDGLTNYSPAAGEYALREAIADRVSAERPVNPPYQPEDVLVQPGGKPVIMKFLMSVVNPGDTVAYPSPGYPLYESLIRFLGGIPRPYTFTTVGGTDGPLALDMPVLEQVMQQEPRPRVLVWNDLHNPTGYSATAKERARVAELAVDANMWVLSDEAYYHLVYEKDVGESIVQQPQMRERTVVLITSSKTWAMTGWRVGAAIGPRAAINAMIKLATNDEGCTNHFVQAAAIAAFQNLPETHEYALKIVSQLRERRDVLVRALSGVPGFKVPGNVAPRSTFYLWVDVTEAFSRMGLDHGTQTGEPKDIAADYESFRHRILAGCGVAFCCRVHFGDALPGEKRRYVRFAFSGIDVADIKTGIDELRKFMESVPSPAPIAKKNADSNTREKAVPKFPRRITLEGGRKPRIFCTRKMPEDAFKVLDGIANIEIWPEYDAPPRDVLVSKAKQCDGLITLLTDPVDEQLLAECPNLQVVSQYAVGFNNIDLGACTRHGVRVSNTPGVLSDTVVETSIALLTACSRRIVEADKYVREGRWKVAWHPLMLLGADLDRSTLGIVGCGRIGGKLARVAREIGARVIYYDVYPNDALEQEGIVTRVESLDELCAQSDFISIHVNLTKETHHLFDSARLARCKKGCIIVNTARGPVIDQQALVEALRDDSHPVAAAGLDVFEQEPIPKGDPILELDNVVLLPHLGSASISARAAMSRLVGENMRAYWEGQPMPHLVNSDVEK